MRTTVRTFHDVSRRLASLVILAFCVPCALAQGTHLWTQSQQEEFEKGTPQGVAIGSDNMLRPAPAVKELLTTPSTFVWSLATDKAGNVYAATGAPATVLRIGPDGKPFTLFETRDVSVQVVRMGPDGNLYAATLPSGKVYKLNPAATAKQDDSTAMVVFDPARLENAGAQAGKGPSDNRSHYVWDIAFDPAGRMYIATGGPAAVYRVDVKKAGAAPELFFKSDEQHIRCLAWDGKGDLIAGTDGSGLVYRINPQGKGYVLYEAARREIPAIAVGANGTIYAASVGDKSRNPLPPLPVQGTGVVTFTVVQPQSLQAANASSSAPEGTEIYALEPNQAPRKLWSGKNEIVYAMQAQKDGLLVLTGNEGRLFKIHDDGTFADVAHLDAQQALTFTEGASASRPGAVLIGTGNTGKLVEFGAAGTHEYASDVLDAGALARFGRIEVEPGSSGYELQTRSGNVEQPVRGWSDWQPLNNGQIASPPGRFLQWKAVLQPNGVLGGVGVDYLPVNSAPVVDEVVVVPGARLNPQTQTNQPQTVNISLPSSGNATVTFDSNTSGSLSAVKDRNAVTARWGAHDDNGDDLVYSLYLRGDGESKWWLLKDHITDKAYTFDGNLLPDGGYWLKVVASDAPSHTPGDALTGEKVSDRFEIDTTPPVVSNLQASETSAGAIHVVFDAEDAMSPVVKAEYSLDAGRWQYIDPVGKISDSRHEHYDFEIPVKALEGTAGEHLITVRAYDRHDNAGLAKTTFHTAAK